MGQQGKRLFSQGEEIKDVVAEFDRQQRELGNWMAQEDLYL